jgi:hypothetical protein
MSDSLYLGSSGALLESYPTSVADGSGGYDQVLSAVPVRDARAVVLRDGLV